MAHKGERGICILYRWMEGKNGGQRCGDPAREKEECMLTDH